jgi:hypothetical protein
MSQDDDDVPPLDPKRVAVFVILLGMIAFAGWRYWQARAAVAAVAEASKDYRKLFPARSTEAPAPPPKPILATEAPVSGIGMLKIDDDMRAPKKAPPSAEPPAALPQAPPQAEAPPVAVEKAAPVKPVSKTFSRPRLNSGAFSGLNGGSGIGFSAGTAGGGGGGVKGAAAPAVPAIPGMPAVPAMTDKK